MSKKSKTSTKQDRLKRKRATKATQQARYQGYAEAGQNKKSKRFRGKYTYTIRAISHPNGRCGNVGCKRCFGISFASFLIGGKPYRMPSWMYNKWKTA